MELPESVNKALDAFVSEAKIVFEDRLLSVVLYGSAAEGRLRKTSDVNVVLVARSYTPTDAAALTAILTFASAAIDLQVMFLLESELATASQIFAVKFSDISRRRRVLFGSDPFAALTISKEALVARLRQVLLNHLLRLRYVFALRNESAEQLTQILADSISPLRACASAFLEIRGVAFEDPKQALEIVAAEIRSDGFKKSLSVISEAREGNTFALDEIKSALSDVLELTSRMKELIKSLVL
jgi:predicted nucleotidyltransferase